MRHERESITNKSTLVRFPSLPDPMHSILRNAETFSVDVTEFTHARKTLWGLVFYGVKSKLLYYYRLGSKYPTASSTLYSSVQFISEHGIPGKLIMDSHRVLGAGNKWK